MYWQRKLERTAVSMTLNNVYKLLLPYQGKLGSILLRISGTEVSGLGSAALAWRIIDFISQIQVVLNGSIIAKSLTGYEAQALAFHDQGVMPPADWRNYAANSQVEYMLINFGRWFKDDGLGLDLGAYTSAELWITNTATAAQFADLTVTVAAYYLQDAPQATWPGYLRTEEWQTWVTVADQWIYNNLPTELPIRRIMLQAIPGVDGSFIENTGMHNLMDDISFALDTGNVQVYRGPLENLMRENYFEYGKLVIAGGWPYNMAGHGVRLDVGYQNFGVTGGGTQAGTVTTTDPTIDSARSSYTQVYYGHVADHPPSIIGFGMAPFETAMLLQNQYDDPVTYLDPNARKTVKLDIHTRNLAGAAGGRNAIILDRLQMQGR